MKQDWKPDELRATAEEIRKAVMPKSITPEMVGGTLVGLVDGIAEVIALLGGIPKEHVKVNVRGYDGTNGVSGAGATVSLDMFHTKGYPCVSLPRQELTADNNGVVEFEVPHGFKYAISSHIDGLGASFQLVETAAAQNRELTLWNLPIGINHLYMAAVFSSDSVMCSPAVFPDYSNDSEELAENGMYWEAGLNVFEDYCDWYYYGILVSTADTAFVIGPENLSPEKMPWCGMRDFDYHIPGMPYYDNENAIRDMDGNMNTAKILDYCHEPKAAGFCVDKETEYYDEQRWMPSAGQASLMAINNKAINTLMAQVNETGDYTFALLPYKDEAGKWQSPNGHDETWWTSTTAIRCAWYVYNGGSNGCTFRTSSNDVRAVSAFKYEY